MGAVDNRSIITSKLDKAAALLCGWRDAASPEAIASATQELQQSLRENHFEPAPQVRLAPYFLEAGEVRELTRCVRALCAIFEKTNKLALTHVAFLRQLEISPNVEELLRREPETRLSIEFARLDFVPAPGGPRIIEVTTDAPRGSILGASLQRALLAHPLASRAGIARLQPSAPNAALIADLFMAVWDERGKENILRPNVAVIDWRESESRPAQENLIAELRGRGLLAERVDPREFSYDREKRELRRGETRFDALYRSISVRDIAVRRMLLSEFLDAVADDAVTLVNPLRSRPAGGAPALEILTTPEFDGFFTSAENEFKARLLPWTRVLSQRYTSFHGREIDLLQAVESRPERFVIKSSGVSGRGEVTLGAFTSREQWLARISDGLRQGDVVQEYVPPARHDDQHLLLCAFAVRGEYAGCTGYLSSRPVIEPRNSAVIPVLEVGGRSKTGPIEAGRPTRKRKPTNTQQN